MPERRVLDSITSPSGGVSKRTVRLFGSIVAVSGMGVVVGIGVPVGVGSDVPVGSGDDVNVGVGVLVEVGVTLPVR